MSNGIDAYIAASHFTANKLGATALPPDRIYVKPNFLAHDPGAGNGTGGHVLYLGRLSPEKGVATLLSAWESLREPPLLKIAGTGPLEEDVRHAAARSSHIEYLGFASDELVDRTMKEAAYLVIPSLNYEGFPKTIVEALARGTPVVASRLGAMEEAIEDGVTGRLFTAGDPADLASVVGDLQRNPHATSAMRGPARSAFVERYTPDRNYAIMTEIYRQALARRALSRKGGA
jgi:glycosyltransferase involved in cell wall biosynthesis